MNWVKVYNSLPTHPKILQAGTEASWLYVCGLCYCNEHLTDGFISDRVLRGVAPQLGHPLRASSVLVEVGLWNRTEDGWQVHNYTDVQRSAAQVKEIRRKDVERKTPNSNGIPAGVQMDSIRLARSREVEKKREDLKAPPNPPQAGGNRKRDREVFMKDLIEWAGSVGVTEIPNRIEAPGTNLLKAYNTAQPWLAPNPTEAFKEACTRYSERLVIQ